MNRQRNADDNSIDDLPYDDMFEDAMAAYREVTEGVAPHDAGKEVEAEEQAPETESAPRDDASGNRDHRGRFKPKTVDDPKAKAADEQVNNAAQQPAEGQEQPAQPQSAAAPPPSWGVKAKAAWGDLPQAVRDEIGKREREVGDGLAALRDYKDLKPYAEMARQHNTTISAALGQYVALERLLEQDVAGGLAVIAERATQGDRARLGQVFSALAQRFGGSPQPATPSPTPSQGGGKDDQLAEVLAPLLNPLLSQINEIKEQFSQRTNADRNAQVSTLTAEIQRFSSDPNNVYFANVEQQIAQLFASGMVPNSGNPGRDLKTAYDMAIRLNPEIQEALIEKRANERLAAERQKERERAEKAKSASRSMGGSRVQGLTYTKGEDRKGGADDLEADVREAYRAHTS